MPFQRGPGAAALGTYSNAETHERVDFAEVREKAVALSTALVRDYGLLAGQTVSIFSTNTVWYAVALWATIRVGMCGLGRPPIHPSSERLVIAHVGLTCRQEPE